MAHPPARWPLPEPPLYIVRDESSLNRADQGEIHRHYEKLDGYKKNLLGMVEEKIQRQPQRYDRDNYLQTASFLILCNSPSARRLAFCGIPSVVNPSGRCRLHQFCPYCCWKVRNAAQLTYVPGFYQGTWHFLTGSFTGDLPFTGSDGYDWLHYWDAYKCALAALVDEGLVAGVYWTEELAVNSFLPARVLPHVHAIIDAPELTDDTLDTLKQKVSKHLMKNLGPDCLPPDVKTSAMGDQKELFDRIGYMLKPMKLLRPYEKAWAGASFHNRARAWELNSELTDIIEGHSAILRRRPKMRGKGTLNPRAKIFIGVRRKHHSKREYQELINELKKAPVEFIQDVPAVDEAPVL